MIVEKTLDEIATFLRKFIFTLKEILFNSKRTILALRRKFFLRKFLHPLFFMSLSILAFIFYTNSINQARISSLWGWVDAYNALRIFGSQFENINAWETIVMAIGIISFYIFYTFLVGLILIKNKNERKIIRHFMYYWCGVECLIYIIVFFLFHYVTHTFHVKFNTALSLFYCLLYLSYALPLIISLLSLWKTYRFSKKKIIALLIAIAIMFSLDIVYISMGFVNSISKKGRISEITIKGNLGSDSLVAVIIPGPKIDSGDFTRNYQFKMYICNNSDDLFLIPRDGSFAVRYLTAKEFATFPFDTIFCPPTEGIRKDTVWYDLTIIGSEDSLNSEIKINPKEVKWISVKMPEIVKNKRFNLENCYPHKLIKFYGFISKGYPSDEKYKWKKIEIEQFVLFRRQQ